MRGIVNFLVIHLFQCEQSREYAADIESILTYKRRAGGWRAILEQALVTGSQCFIQISGIPYIQEEESKEKRIKKAFEQAYSSGKLGPCSCLGNRKGLDRRCLYKVVLRVKGSITVSKGGPSVNSRGGDDAVMISELIGQECLGEVYNTIEIEINRNFYTFTDFYSLELEVPTFCLVTQCVSAHRDRRYHSLNRTCRTSPSHLRSRHLRIHSHQATLPYPMVTTML